MIGSFSYFKKGLVNIKTSVVFGLPAIFAVFMTRAYLVPALPSELLRFDNFVLSRDMMLMLLFAVLMLFASYSMIKEAKALETEVSGKQKFSYPLILLEGGDRKSTRLNSSH